MYRVLRPGGVVRLTIPDLRKIIALYEDRNPEMRLEQYIPFLDAISCKTHERPCQMFPTTSCASGATPGSTTRTTSRRSCGRPGSSTSPAVVSDPAHMPSSTASRTTVPLWQNTVEAMTLEATKPVALTPPGSASASASAGEAQQACADTREGEDRRRVLAEQQRVEPALQQEAEQAGTDPDGEHPRGGFSAARGGDEHPQRRDEEHEKRGEAHDPLLGQDVQVQVLGVGRDEQLRLVQEPPLRAAGDRRRQALAGLGEVAEPRSEHGCWE